MTPPALGREPSMHQRTLSEYQSDDYECPKCGSCHDTYIGVKIHYGRAHEGSIAGEEAQCAVCDETFRGRRSQLEKADRPVCSKKCNLELLASVEPWNKKPPETTECEQCGSEFQHIPSADREFCSRECYYAYDSEQGLKRGENNPNYSGGKQSTVCEWCGEEYKVYPSRRSSRFCSYECMYGSLSHQTGPDHPLWRGGIDWYRKIRSTLGPTGWHTQRKENLGDKCALCGESEGTLVLHHIVPVLAGGTNAEYNYMTLCQSCHTTVEQRTEAFTDPVLKA
jgi:ribosomal protein L34E